MNYLLDTHVCIWALSEQNKLSVTVKEILQNNNNRFWISKISLFEIVIKKRTARIEEFDIAFPEFIQSVSASGYSILEVKNEHLEAYNHIAFNETHRDPFDRYLLAAAQYEDFAFITKDEKFQFYTNTFNIVW